MPIGYTDPGLARTMPNQVLNYAQGGNMPLPLLAAAAIPAGIQGLTGLLGSLVAPNKEKKAAELSQKNWEKQRKTRLQDTMKYLKPSLPRYAMEKDMPVFDSLMKKLMLGGLEKSFGGGAGNMGIDFKSLLSSIGQPASPSSMGLAGAVDQFKALQGAGGGGDVSTITPTGLTYGGQGMGRDAFIQRILSKYGMDEGQNAI